MVHRVTVLLLSRHHINTFPYLKQQQVIFFTLHVKPEFGIRGLMEEKGLMEEDWNDRDNWRKNII